jgi:hypothetical protein
MWTRRKRTVSGALATDTRSEDPVQDPVSLLEWYFPAAIEEHPAKRRIRRSNEIAEAMYPHGGRHRVATD